MNALEQHQNSLVEKAVANALRYHVKTENEGKLRELLTLDRNRAYDAAFGITERDLARYDELKAAIEARTTATDKKPEPGDVFNVCHYDTRYGRARADRETWKPGCVMVCVSPMEPHVSLYDGAIETSTSGGPWTHVSVADLEHNGTTEATFWFWGGGIPGAERGISMTATVNQWKQHEEA